MDKATARAVLEQMGQRPNFITVGKHTVNLNQVGHADYDCENGHINIYGMARGHAYEKMDKETALAILDQLSKRSNFIAAGNQVVNINQVGHAKYDEEYGKIRFYGMARGSTYEEMDKESTQDVLKKIRQAGQRMAVLGAYGANRDQLRYSLQEARAWENDYRNTHQDDSDNLMDYLPLIIVAAIILFDDNDQQLGMNGPDAFDEPDAADGTYMDQDFADASGLNDMDTDMDSDLGIDSFEADFDDMAADIDTDMDMDCDSDGFDAGGDIGGGCDFGGFDM